MISLSISNVLALPLLIALIIVVICAIYYTVKNIRGFKKTNRRIYQCNNCGRVYTDPRLIPVAKCPRCGESNESIRT